VLAIRLLNAPPIRSAASKKANYAAVEVK